MIRVEMDKTLATLRDFIKDVIIETVQENPDLFRMKTIIQETESDVLLNSTEAAKFLNISIKKIYQLKDSGIINSIGVGRKLLFDRKELLDSIKQYSGKAKSKNSLNDGLD